MKLLSIVIPCYNSQDYLDHCIRTLLPGGEEVEIIIVDDGSTDRTPEMADAYAKKYPSIVRAVHQPNKGHGGALNTGMDVATGLFFKVVDSDDWVDGASYRKILDTLRRLTDTDCEIDMMISNFVYEKAGARHKKRMTYKRILPVDQVFGWKDIKRARLGEYMLMHSIIYRTAFLRGCHLVLPEHTFYEDNLFAYIPLPKVRRMYYLDVDFYRYFIGREDQSVNEKMQIARIGQQVKINKMMIDAYDPFQVKNKQLRHYILNYIELICIVTSCLCIKSNTDEDIARKRKLWKYIRRKNPKLYKYLTRHYMGFVFNLPKKLGNKQVVVIYEIVRRVFGLN